ncbi:MAG: hypothetical protein ACRDZO_13910 [Egibacteraceae bacterium]
MKSAVVGQKLIVGMAQGATAARYFSERSGLTTTVVRDLPELIDLIESTDAQALLVSGGTTLGTGELAALCRTATERGRHLGFIAGWGHPDASLHHARKLLSSEWSDTSRMLAWSATGFGGLHGNRGQDLSILSPSDKRLVQELARGHRAVALASHGNGIDGPLGSHVLCSMVDEKPAMPGKDFFPCGNGGPCIRSRLVGDVLVPPDRVSPRIIAADVLVWQSCWGVLADDAVFDPARSLAQDIIRSPHIRALITTHTHTTMEHVTVLYALALLRQGRSLGEATLLLNELSMRQAPGDAPWILIGDPELQLPADALQDNATRVINGADFTFDPCSLHLLTLESVDAALLTAKRRDGLDLPKSEFLLRKIPETPHAVVAYTGVESVTCTIQAYPRQRVPVPFRLLEAIWGSVPQLAFTIRFLEHTQRDAHAGHCPAPPALVSTLRDALHRSMRSLALLSRQQAALSGSESALTSLTKAEVGRWRTLNERLLAFLVEYCQTATANLSAVYQGDCRVHLRRPAADNCPYCGLPVEVRELPVPLTEVTRKTVWCCRCAYISDTSVESSSLWLEGPASCRPGTEVVYQLRGELSVPVKGLLHLQAALTLDRVPWLHAQSKPVALSLHDGQQSLPPAELSLTLPEGTPPGVYFLVGVAAVQGEPWIARRPFVVLPDDHAGEHP